MNDEQGMRKALEVAAASRVRAHPNPWVGAVVEPGGFAGATSEPGGAHAEVLAIDQAAGSATGATLYVTLEPCCPAPGKQTAGCVGPIIDAGISRVVIGVEDPDPRVRGAGIAALRDAGVEVVVGVLSDAVARQLAPYLKHRREGVPFVVLKLAATLDGATAAPDGSSQWITGEAARADAHRLRAESDAVLVGAGTVRADDPSLTVRHVDGRDPRRVVLGRAPADAKVHPCDEVEGDLAEVLARLGAEGVVQLLVEGGAGVAGAFHRAGLVDQYVLYLAPALLGGEGGRGVFAGPAAPTIADVWRGEMLDVERLGSDLKVVLGPVRNQEAA